MSTTSEILPNSARRWRSTLLLLVILIGLVNVGALLHAPRALDPSRAGSWRAKLESTDRFGWLRVTELKNGSPLAAAGIEPGDQIRFQYFTDVGQWGDGATRPLDTQETIQLRVRKAVSPDGEIAITVKPAPDLMFETGQRLVNYIAGWTARFIGLALVALMAIKRPDDIALRGLSFVFLAENILGWYFLPGGLFHDIVELVLNSVSYLVLALGPLWFALQYPKELRLWPHPLARMVFFVNLVLICGTELVQNGVGKHWIDPGQSRLWAWFFASAWVVAPLNTLSLIAAQVFNVWRAWGALRTRLLWVSVAMFGFTGMNAVLSLLAWTPLWPWVGPWTYTVGDLSWLIGAVLMVWAVLRHGVFDFAVVLQRTLALSVLSSCMVTALGIGKWLTERLLHDAGLPRGPWVDLVVAVIVVTAFAVVQRPLLAWCDTVVFRRWHAASQALRDFVERAALLTERALMQQRFVAAVDAFVQGQGSAVYTARAQGILRLAHGTLPSAPQELDANDLLSVELRHGAHRVDMTRLTGSAASCCAEWSFAMRVGGRVSGALLLGPKPESAAYRAEELALLEDSTRRIGLDLESLRVAELERDINTLVMKNSLLMEMEIARGAQKPEAARA